MGEAIELVTQRRLQLLGLSGGFGSRRAFPHEPSAGKPRRDRKLGGGCRLFGLRVLSNKTTEAFRQPPPGRAVLPDRWDFNKEITEEIKPLPRGEAATNPARPIASILCPPDLLCDLCVSVISVLNRRLRRRRAVGAKAPRAGKAIGCVKEHPLQPLDLSSGVSGRRAFRHEPSAGKPRRDRKPGGGWQPHGRIHDGHLVELERRTPADRRSRRSSCRRDGRAGPAHPRRPARTSPALVPSGSTWSNGPTDRPPGSMPRASPARR